jgi:cAMP phosphodiesterase
MFFKPLLNRELKLGDFGALSIKVGEKILIDAGTVIATLKREELAKITDIFITHAHLDHVKDLGFIGESLYSIFDHTINVWGTAQVIKIIKENIFNGKVWADFTKLPDENKPILTFREMMPEKHITIDKYKVLPVEVNHCPGAVGLVIGSDEGNVVITGDTGPTDAIWKEVNRLEGDITIYIETSFPDRLADVAKMTGHMTPSDLKNELDKIKKDAVIYICHVKIPYYDEVVAQIMRIGDKRLRILE